MSGRERAIGGTWTGAQAVPPHHLPVSFLYYTLKPSLFCFGYFFVSFRDRRSPLRPDLAEQSRARSNRAARRTRRLYKGQETNSLHTGNLCTFHWLFDNLQRLLREQLASFSSPWPPREVSRVASFVNPALEYADLRQRTTWLYRGRADFHSRSRRRIPREISSEVGTCSRSSEKCLKENQEKSEECLRVRPSESRSFYGVYGSADARSEAASTVDIGSGLCGGRFGGAPAGGV